MKNRVCLKSAKVLFIGLIIVGWGMIPEARAQGIPSVPPVGNVLTLLQNVGGEVIDGTAFRLTDPNVVYEAKAKRKTKRKRKCKGQCN